MIQTNNPWKDISTPLIGKISRIRVNESLIHNVYWFRDSSDRIGLQIQINNLTVIEKANLDIRDISIDVINEKESNYLAIDIRLENKECRDIFFKLCLDIIDHVSTVDVNKNIFEVVCNRLLEWQYLFHKENKKTLTLNEIKGLFSELYFIFEILKQKPSFENLLIKGWQGPDRVQQDFIFTDKAVEIKSISGIQQKKVRISSENQLDTHLDNLYLKVYFLLESQNPEEGFKNLNEIVKEVLALLTNRQNKDYFELKLNTLGYHKHSDYNNIYFLVKNSYTYIVKQDFPKIVQKDIPEGIRAVSYDLMLNSIEKFRFFGDIL